MVYLLLGLLFILGTCVGSFLNVVSIRWPEGRSISGRSVCPRCSNQLRWFDLIPVASFLFLRGRCRFCHEPISFQYPFVEILAGFLFLFLGLIFFTAGIPISFFAYFNFALQLFFVSLLLVIAVTDFRSFLILDRLLLILLGGVLVYVIKSAFFLSSSVFIYDFLVPRLVGGVVVSGLLAAVWYVSRGRWVGFGDVKYTAVLGLLLGFPNILVAFLIAAFSGSAVGLALLALGKKHWGDRLPFGVFLSFGAFIALLYGGFLVFRYMQLVGLVY
jgi:leader peptidase (prepilin peptidase)/N-methyltransferase